MKILFLFLISFSFVYSNIILKKGNSRITVYDTTIKYCNDDSRNKGSLFYNIKSYKILDNIYYYNFYQIINTFNNTATEILKYKHKGPNNKFEKIKKGTYSICISE